MTSAHLPSDGGDSHGADTADPATTDPRVDDGLAREHLFGLDMIDAENLETVLEVVLRESPSRYPLVKPMLLTPNVDIMVHLDNDPDSVEAEIFRQAQYVLPDGMPIVVASRFLGAPLSARLPGSGLFEILWPRLAAENRSVLVLCADSEIAEHLANEHPEAQCVVSPWFDVNAPAEVDAVVDRLLESLPERPVEFVLLGIGHPKDSIVADRLLERWPSEGTRRSTDRPLVMGLGGSFAMYAGFKKRAPTWVQKIGLEWFYRFTQEPKRLFRRYFIRDIGFIGIMYREHRHRRRRATKAEHSTS